MDTESNMDNSLDNNSTLNDTTDTNAVSDVATDVVTTNADVTNANVTNVVTDDTNDDTTNITNNVVDNNVNTNVSTNVSTNVDTNDDTNVNNVVTNDNNVTNNTANSAANNAAKTVHPLNDSWWLWTHAMKDEDWSKDSYKRLGDKIVTVEQFLGLNRKLINCVSDSMFFLMRHGPFEEPICPMWEDPVCIKGGAWKFKVTRSDAAKAWTDIAIRLIGETISESPEEILGVSISPKKTFVTIRIWNSDAKKNDQSQLLIPNSEYFRNVLFDSHSDYNKEGENPE